LSAGALENRGEVAVLPITNINQDFSTVPEHRAPHHSLEFGLESVHRASV